MMLVLYSALIAWLVLGVLYYRQFLICADMAERGRIDAPIPSPILLNRATKEFLDFVLRARFMTSTDLDVLRAFSRLRMMLAIHLAVFLGVAIFAVATAAGCSREEPGGMHGESGDAEIFDQRITFQDVLQRLRDDDPGRVSRTIVQLAQIAERRNINGLLIALWERDRASFPDLNWAALEQQRVRIAVARVLGKQQSNDPRYRDYLLEMSEHASARHDKVEALGALGVIGNDEDITRLETIAIGQDELLATGALFGLVASNKREALLAVEQMSRDASLPQQRRRFAGELLALPRPPQ